MPLASVLSRMPAMPPCAQFVEESLTLNFVMIVTSCPELAIFNAANNPAMPLPMIVM